MKFRFAAVLVVALLLLLAFAAVALAVDQATIDAIIADAEDGTISGNWTAAEIEAALAYISNDPTAEQYSGVQGELEDYLASLQAPGEQGGELAFTGGEVILLLGAGLALVGGGAYLRRRVSA
jgi:hypothetical protein